jgi:hypothetical protein
MAYELAPFRDVGLSEALLEHLIDEHESERLPRLERLWSYYRNELAKAEDDGGSSGAPAQRAGLPGRLTEPGASPFDDRFIREIVIENDIAWRINTLVDFMFPEAPVLMSRARDERTRSEIDAILRAIIDANGGVRLWQEMALLGSVYGTVDLLVHTSDLRGVARRLKERDGGDGAAALTDHLGGAVVIETVEATRAIPLMSRHDYRVLDAYIVHMEQPTAEIETPSWLSRATQAVLGGEARTNRRATATVTEIYSRTHWQRYEDGRLVAERRNAAGVLPVVHTQNLILPFVYDGLSDVEPLIPLQDELNTRLSDRANRVTMQSFQMWLAKGIEGFTDQPVGPGQMWLTHNPDASIEAFGGDMESPSEAMHLEDLREAMDKTSGVTPAAAGHIRARIGNLTSENALRISLMGTIAKTKRKRITYGASIRRTCELILAALDREGLYATDPSDRGVDIAWADPMPPDETRRIEDAIAKLELGVPAEILRRELGYATDDDAGYGGQPDGDPASA